MPAPLSHIEQEDDLPEVSPEPPSAPPDFTWRRIARFGLIALAILLTANAVVCATWSHFFGLRGWLLWQALPGLLAAAFIPTTILRFRHSHPTLRIVYALSASWLGFLNLAFFAAVACWIVEGTSWLVGRPLPRFQLAAVLFGIAFFGAAYGLVNAALPRVRRIAVQLPHLPEAWRGRTAALITDLHLGPLSGPEFLRRIIARLRSLRPDIVFISGDLFDGPTLGLDRLVAPWRDFITPRGIYYVTGNHDEFSERSIYLKAVTGTGIRVLNNEKIDLEGLQIVGVHDSEAEDPVALREILHRLHLDRRHPSILLAHRPVNLSVAEEEGISFQLSGHTHRGQIWPWNLLVSRIYGRFAYGLNRLGKLSVYTSSGVGTWGPPLRVGTNSEIVLIRFEKENP
jgi:predicted MPP superfamily phosphohydrolase